MLLNIHFLNQILHIIHNLIILNISNFIIYIYFTILYDLILYNISLILQSPIKNPKHFVCYYNLINA